MKEEESFGIKTHLAFTENNIMTLCLSKTYTYIYIYNSITITKFEECQPYAKHMTHLLKKVSRMFLFAKTRYGLTPL